MLLSSFSCPACHGVMQTANPVEEGRMIKCSNCGVVFPVRSTPVVAPPPVAARPAPESSPAPPKKRTKRPKPAWKSIDAAEQSRKSRLALVVVSIAGLCFLGLSITLLVLLLSRDGQESPATAQNSSSSEVAAGEGSADPGGQGAMSVLSDPGSGDGGDAYQPSGYENLGRGGDRRGGIDDEEMEEMPGQGGSSGSTSGRAHLPPPAPPPPSTDSGSSGQGSFGPAGVSVLDGGYGQQPGANSGGDNKFGGPGGKLKSPNAGGGVGGGPMVLGPGGGYPSPNGGAQPPPYVRLPGGDNRVDNGPSIPQGGGPAALGGPGQGGAGGATLPRAPSLPNYPGFPGGSEAGEDVPVPPDPPPAPKRNNEGPPRKPANWPRYYTELPNTGPTIKFNNSTDVTVIVGLRTQPTEKGYAMGTDVTLAPGVGTILVNVRQTKYDLYYTVSESPNQLLRLKSFTPSGKDEFFVYKDSEGNYRLRRIQ